MALFVPSLTETKRTLRTQVQAQLAALAPRVRAQEEELVQAAVQSEPAWGHARTVLLYKPVAPELSVVGLANQAWRTGKRVLFPRIEDAGGGVLSLREATGWSELRPGPFGIPAPPEHAPEVSPSQVQVAIVPGMAWDARGGRLGRGGGYYDRLLPLLGGLSWGVGFSCQLVGDVPREEHDRKVHRVFTPQTVVPE